MTALTHEPALIEVIELQAGGTLTLLRLFDGTYRLHIDTGGEDGFALSCPLASRDVRGLRMATGTMVCSEFTEVR